MISLIFIKMEPWIEKIPQDDNWIKLIFLLCFITISILRAINPFMFSYLIRIFDPILFFKLFDKEKTSLYNNFFLTGYVFSVIVFSITIFLIFEKIFPSNYNFKKFLIILVSIVFISILRFLIIKFFAKIIGFNRFINSFFLKNMTFFIQLNISLFILTLIYVFLFDYSKYFLFTYTIIAYFLFIFSQFWVVFFYLKNLKSNVLYLILYICAFKISPWILIYSNVIFLRH